ncbi:MAG: hypothetical protein QCI00_04465, partial [Candidatus Thermoplasmatota archaeon]|nr:hypothetical protein [Candidatus Thermoplasmatota archaeon]
DVLDDETEQIRKTRWDEFVGKKQVVQWSTHISNMHSDENEKNEMQLIFDELRVNHVAQMQFGPDIATVLFQGNVSMVKSKKTKKIRNVFVNEHHVVSMRASDGLFILKLHGGKKIHKHSHPPRFRIIVDDEAVPFIKEGKSVFSKFVISADDTLRPYDDCIVVSENDEFLAVGQCLLSPCEMGVFRSGLAVKIREHVDD